MSSSECVGIAVVFRHGARGLGRSSRKFLRSHEQRTDSHACAAWADHELEHITSVGIEQMRQLGLYVGSEYVPRILTPAAVEAVRSTSPVWRSSIVERVRESGRAFLSGLSDGLPGIPVPSAPKEYSCDDETDFLFRNWCRDSRWLDAIDQLRASDEIRSAAVAQREELISLYTALTGAAAEATAAGSDEDVAAALRGIASSKDERADEGRSCSLEGGSATDADRTISGAVLIGGPSDDDDDLALKLFHTTYMKELLDCERHWPATAAALGSTSGISKPSPRLNDGSAAADDGSGVKCALHSRLSPVDEAFLCRSANWVWERRFLSSPITQQYRGLVGGPLVREVLQHLLASASASAASSFAASSAAPAPSLLSLFSLHDYTLFSMLGALRMPHLPATPMGFGGFLLFECWRDAPAGTDTAPAAAGGIAGAAAADIEARHPGLSVTLKACLDPFPLARNGSPTQLCVSLAGPEALGDPPSAAGTGTGLQTLFERVSMASLLSLAQAWPVWAPMEGYKPPGSSF